MGMTLAFHFGTRDSPGTLVETLVTVLTAGTGAAAELWRRASRTGTAPLALERAADELAEQLRRQWERATLERGLASPQPISVRWRWSPRQVTGPIGEAVGGAGGRRFAPLPGLAAVTEEQLRSGTLQDLLGVYGGLGSGRLVILGEPGAGKSGAGILLLCAALAHRATLTAEDRARVPVPVLVTPQGWDPTAEPFAKWLAGYLVRNYALLRAPEYGGDAAMRLIGDGGLAVILDGLDEMPEALRPVALRALDEQAAFRLVVLTRAKELVAAVSGGHLRGAAALELLPIGPGPAAGYLASGLIDPLPARWRHMIDHLRECPEGVLAQALTTPLMLSLVRDTYGSGEEVDELIDGRRFPTREAVEDHLLDRVLTAAYTRHPGRPVPPYTVDQARRWLGQLAHQMNEDGTRDLAWWGIPRWVPAWPRAVATVAVMCLVSAILVVSLNGPIAHTYLRSTFQVGPLIALVAVFAKVLGYAFMFGPGLLLVSPPGGGAPRQRERWSRTDILMILLLGAGVGVGSGLENGLLSGLKYGLKYGLVSGFVVGLGFVLGGGPPQRLGWLRWSETDTRANLRAGLVIGLVIGFVVGLGYGFGYGLKYGLEYGFIVGIGYLLVIVFGGRASHQRSQLRWSRTSTPTVLLIGLLIAFVSTPGYGIIYVLIVMLGGRPSQQRRQLRLSRTITPAALLTGLVAGPVFWLWYQITTGTDVGVGLGFGLSFGLTAGLLLGLRPSMEATSPLDPQSSWRRERQFGLVFGLVLGLVVGLAYGLVDGLKYGLASGLVYGLTGGLVAGLGSGLVSSATWATALAGAQLQRQDKAPARLLRFLDDARQRQVLRTVGPVYQFRDTRLQDRLAETYEPRQGKVSDTHVVPA
ncbi:MAG: NACHT domain-containing protein [Pseudonocardiaceae bacterium]